MLRLYDFLESGNGYKVRLILNQLQIAYERIELDITRGESRTPEFLARNPNGRIPTLEFEDGRHLAESNAILFHLAEATPLLPDDAWLRAQVLQWMFFEQYSHEPYIAVVRFWSHQGSIAEKGKEVEERQARGRDALAVMDGHLAANDFFVGARYTIADIALYAYTHVAHEGGFDLAPYAHVKSWLVRVSEQERHIPITHG